MVYTMDICPEVLHICHKDDAFYSHCDIIKLINMWALTSSFFVHVYHKLWVEMQLKLLTNLI